MKNHCPTLQGGYFDFRRPYVEKIPIHKSLHNFDEVLSKNVSTIMEMNTAIATAIQEQSTVVSEVNKHLVEIRDVAEQAGQISHQNAQMCEELSQQAGVLNNEVSRFKV